MAVRRCRLFLSLGRTQGAKQPFFELIPHYPPEKLPFSPRLLFIPCNTFLSLSRLPIVCYCRSGSLSRISAVLFIACTLQPLLSPMVCPLFPANATLPVRGLLNGRDFLHALTKFLSLCLNGELPAACCSYFCGGRFATLAKENGGIRPIAV